MMGKHEAKIIIEKERTKRARIYENIAGKVGVIVGAVLFIVFLVITFYFTIN